MKDPDCSLDLLEPMPIRWRVRRYAGATGNVLAKDYGTFLDKHAAELVAQRSAEKHLGCIVVVEPVR